MIWILFLEVESRHTANNKTIYLCGCNMQHSRPAPNHLVFVYLVPSLPHSTWFQSTLVIGWRGNCRSRLPSFSSSPWLNFVSHCQPSMTRKKKNNSLQSSQDSWIATEVAALHAACDERPQPTLRKPKLLFLKMSGLSLSLFTAIWMQVTSILTCCRAAEEHTYSMHVFPESNFVPSAVFCSSSSQKESAHTSLPGAIRRNLCRSGGKLKGEKDK